MDTDLSHTVPPSISPDELRALLGTPAAPRLLDVRRAPRFAQSPWLLAGARWCAPEDVAAFARSEPPGEVVVYCVYGHEVSREATRTLVAAGWRARFLEGGFEGGEAGVDAPEDIARWRAVALPRARKEALAPDSRLHGNDGPGSTGLGDDAAAGARTR